MKQQMNAVRTTTNCLIFTLGISTYAICLYCSGHSIGSNTAAENVSRDLRAPTLINHACGEGTNLDKRLMLFGKSLCKIDSVDGEDHPLPGQPARVKVVAELKSDLVDRRLRRSSSYADQFGILPSYVAVEQAMIEPRALITNVTPIVDRYRE
jgi:hypothetical protein